MAALSMIILFRILAGGQQTWSSGQILRSICGGIGGRHRCERGTIFISCRCECIFRVDCIACYILLIKTDECLRLSGEDSSIGGREFQSRSHVAPRSRLVFSSFRVTKTNGNGKSIFENVGSKRITFDKGSDAITEQHSFFPSQYGLMISVFPTSCQKACVISFFPQRRQFNPDIAQEIRNG
jgi:hypothetical protein